MRYPEYYKDWITDLRNDAKEFGLWQADSIENRGDLDYHFHQYLVDLGQILAENREARPFIWLARAEKEIAKLKERLSNKYSIPDDTGDRANNPIGNSGELFGFPIVTPQTITSGWIKRKKFFTTLPALIDYISEVPYIKGIEIIYGIEGQVIGYQIWVGND